MATTLVNISLPKEYGYVLITVAASFAISSWHGSRVVPFRKRADVPYPNLYASAETVAAAPTADKKDALLRYNCAQRAHGNFQEHYPVFLAGALLAGINYPLASTALSVVWLLSRVAYAVGYTNGTSGGRGRYAGGLGMLYNVSWVGYLGLIGKAGYDLITA